MVIWGISKLPYSEYFYVNYKHNGMNPLDPFKRVTPVPPTLVREMHEILMSGGVQF